MRTNECRDPPRGMGEEELHLAPSDLERLGEENFRSEFIVSAMDLASAFGLDALPEGFPAYPSRMTTEEMVEALKKFSYWFDPKTRDVCADA